MCEHNSLGTRTYWLDPDRGWSAVRVRDDYPDGQWGESRTALELQDGVWFPAAVESYSSRYKDGTEPACVVRVFAATFNRPEHAPELTIADIGIEPGMTITRFDRDKKRADGRWDGTQIVPTEEYERRLVRGETVEGPNFLRALNDLHDQQTRAGSIVSGAVPPPPSLPLAEALAAATAPRDQPLSLWEKYVEDFIRRYELDREQRQQAVRVLRSCQQQAGAYLRRHKADFERLDQADQPANGGPSATQPALKLRKLLEPIDNIFNKQLRPRLELIPTRKQRRAVEGRTPTTLTTTQPGSHQSAP